MSYIINGKELALSLKQEMAANVATFTEKYGRVPHLVVILVGEDPGSVSYVTGKAKASEEVGKDGEVSKIGGYAPARGGGGGEP